MPVSQADYQKAMHDAHEAFGALSEQFKRLTQTNPSGPGTTEDSKRRRRALCLNTYNAAVKLSRAMIVAGEIVEPKP